MRLPTSSKTSRIASRKAASQWLEDYLASVKTIYAFQHLQGSETVEGSNALHALRSKLWERGDAILQADGEGFTNEEGYHIVWQFSDSVSGPWNMGVLQDGVWRHFSMDLGDPDHRAAFLKGAVPDDLTCDASDRAHRAGRNSSFLSRVAQSFRTVPTVTRHAESDPLKLN